MFDANARHIPLGQKFFIECHSLRKDSFIYNKFLKVGGIYLCEKVEGDSETYQMKVYLNKTCKDYITIKTDMHCEENFDYDSFFVYSGCPDGSGFIDDEWKQKGLDFLGGEWVC